MSTVDGYCASESPCCSYAGITHESPDVSDRTPVCKPKSSRRPQNTAFKQQNLPAWQPVISARSAVPTFLGLSFLLIPIGVAMLAEYRRLIEVSYDYTDCESMITGEKCHEVRSNTSRVYETCECNITLDIKESMKREVYVYYGLTNFFQNHRRYVKSRDDRQLNGQNITKVSNNCKPYNGTKSGKIAAPCGAIANSMFNDTFILGNQLRTFSINRTGIAWVTDKEKKFNNPPGGLESLKSDSKPAFWQKPVYELDPSNPENNGYKNEALIVWMRTAAFPTFRKLYGRIPTGLSAGTYHVIILYDYPTVEFNGTKRFILSTTGWIGAKKRFLGVAYVIAGCVSLLTGLVLLLIHNVLQRRRPVEI